MRRKLDVAATLAKTLPTLKLSGLAKKAARKAIKELHHRRTLRDHRGMATKSSPK